MSHWLLDKLKDTRAEALKQISRAQIRRELLREDFVESTDLIRRCAEALELAVLDLGMDKTSEPEDVQKELRPAAADAFRLFRVLPRPTESLGMAMSLLRTSALGVLGDKGTDAARWLREESWPELPLKSDDWGERSWATILDIWLRLIRKDGWDDRDAVLERIADLRGSQAAFERDYLAGQEPGQAKASALELIALYHLAKAAEVFAHYMTDGVVDGKYQIQQLLETHFDRVFAVCKQSRMVELDPLSRLLAACALQMANNSIWTVTRAVNSRVTKFVNTLVDRGRGDRAIFDVLPPQRRALAEKGLLGSSRRAVVVSLPTSSGKTLIAEFRILQALNQFDHEHGWVAYLAPTRALVNQISRQLRRDFEPLDIVVEQVSPAMEVDSVETDLLRLHEPGQEFRVLVTTPEKLDLLLRQGWEAEIGRPLTLVVVDEAHGIQNASRGLKLELLLATINSECQRAQFLLLTPFIENARDVARWLGGQNSDDISLAVDWQPNDRVIGIVRSEQRSSTGRKGHDYQLRMESVHTTRQTLAIDEMMVLPKNAGISPTYAKVANPSTMAAVVAQTLQERGPVIVMHQRPDWVWSLAQKLKIEPNRKAQTRNVLLVQEFLSAEFGSSFPLIDLLSFGVGVHHSGLSEDVRALMEWLFELGELRFLVATTTIAHGMNFPVSGVVMASHQYPPYGEDMSTEDFWNIAGRAGRVSQSSLGVVALVAEDQEKANVLRAFVNRQSGELNSALIALAQTARSAMSDLKGIVYNHPEWSTFVQYLAHTYRQMGQSETFADEIEQVLRGTYGFEKLRSRDAGLADQLLAGVHEYTRYLQQPGQPLKLVDSTGFSLQSIRGVLGETGRVGIRAETWNADTLFSGGDRNLQNMMGVLLSVPELRENLKAATGGPSPDGNKLALIIKDWVNGVSIPDIADRYFMDGEKDATKAMTACGRAIYGRLTQTAAWGLGALLSITGSGLSEERLRSLSNLPSRVFYGVNDDSAIALRLLGVPRAAATRLARSMPDALGLPLMKVRSRLREMDEDGWRRALGDRDGGTYRKVWRVLEGLEQHSP